MLELGLEALGIFKSRGPSFRRITESDGKQRMGKVFVMVTDTKTDTGNKMKMVTGESNIHASIITDKYLRKFYSAAQGKGGFTIETPSVYPENATFAIYELPLPSVDVVKVTAVCLRYASGALKFTYDIKAALLGAVGMDVTDGMARGICTQFVAMVFRAAGVSLFGIPFNALTAGDFESHPDFKLVGTGTMGTFSKDVSPITGK